MDNFLSLVLFGLASMFLQNVHGAMDAQKLIAVASECKSLEKATDLDLINLKMNLQPKTRTMKCLTACLLEKVGKIANKKFDSVGVIKDVAKSSKISNKLQKSVVEVINECASIMDPDRCEYASKIVDCLIAGAAKRGISKSNSAF